MRQTQIQSAASPSRQTAAELQDSVRLAQPVELDGAALLEVSGAGPCGGWAPAATGPVPAAAGPCGGW